MFLKRWPIILASVVLCMLPLLLSSCHSRASEKMVVIYTSIDQVYAEPILKDFESKTGIKVLPVYDVESTKTTGLVNRLIAEKNHPQADVFWNSEFVQTLDLKNRGVLAPYKSPSTLSMPTQYFDPQGYWTSTAGRARVILVNTRLLSPEDYPRSIYDLLDPQWPGAQIAIANPLFGTTFTQAAALYAAMGPDKGRSFYEKLQAKGVRVVDGNSVVRDMVSSGQASVGLTDSDDASRAVEEGKPVVMIYPDQDKLGTLILPGTVSVIAQAPHPAEAQQLVDYLLSPEVEQRLISTGFAQIALRPEQINLKGTASPQVKGMSMSFTDIYQQMNQVQIDLEEIFMR